MNEAIAFLRDCILEY